MSELGTGISTVRLTTLEEPQASFDAHVESADGTRIVVTCGGRLKLGAAVSLDSNDRLLLAEVLGCEAAGHGTRALLDVQHSLVYANAEEIRSRLGLLSSRGGAAAV